MSRTHETEKCVEYSGVHIVVSKRANFISKALKERQDGVIISDLKITHLLSVI